MPDWSIKIVPNRSPGQPPQLVPDLVGAKPGDPLQAQEGDLVSWNNTTGQPYQPWPTDQNGTLQAVGGKMPPAPQFQQPFPKLFLSNMIPKNRSSIGYGVVMPTTGNVVFYCLIDANGQATKARGQIVVSKMPPAVNLSPGS